MMTDDEATIEVGQWTWLGRICVIQSPLGPLYVGPHWYCSVIMLSFILGVGIVYTYTVAMEHTALHVLGGLVVTVLSTVCFLHCALSDSGVVRVKSSSAQEAGEANANGEGGADDSSRPIQRREFGRRCSHCNVVQHKGTSHCDFCKVCVEGFDHHCPWMGKCIGSGNALQFYTFLAVSLSSLGYIFIVTVVSTPVNGDGVQP